MTEEERNLVLDIEKAFDGVKRGAITLHEADVMDDYASAEQRVDARLKDSEARWQDVSDTAITECSFALPFLDPDSWRYYIPAFMRWTLRHYGATNLSTDDNTIFALNYRTPESAEYYSLLDDRQSGVVCRFLKLMASQPMLVSARSAEEALQNHWGRFCAG